jgi:hypothetical protein
MLGWVNWLSAKMALNTGEGSRGWLALRVAATSVSMRRRISSVGKPVRPLVDSAVVDRPHVMRVARAF